MSEREPCCPKCGGTAGHKHRMIETYTMRGAWGESAEAAYSGFDVHHSLVECIDCGARFRYDALLRKELV